jgi:hypothetical protein
VLGFQLDGARIILDSVLEFTAIQIRIRTLKVKLPVVRVNPQLRGQMLNDLKRIIVIAHHAQV